MFCPECGTENPDNANFCLECGKKNNFEKTAIIAEPKITKDPSSSLSLGTLINQTKTNIEHDTLLIKEFIDDIELIIKKYDSSDTKNEKEFQNQMIEIDHLISIKKKNLDKKLKIYKSDMIQIQKIRDKNKPFHVTYSTSLKKKKEANNGHDVLFTNSDDKKIKLKYFISGNHIRVPDIEFRSISLVNSDNNNFHLAYNDQHIVNKDGKRKTVMGKAVFINPNELFLINTLERPHDGKVAENGNFILNDWLTPGDYSGIFYAFNSEAEILINTRFNSNLGNNGLSENGQFAVVETAISKSDDQDKIFFFDLNNKKLLWERKRDLGNVKSFKFDLNENRLIIIYEKYGKYRYSFKGEFLDEYKLEKDRMGYGNGYELFDIAKEKMKDLDYKTSDLSDYDEILSILVKSSNKDISSYIKARVYRTIGEIYYNCDKTDEALKNFEKALYYDPKVGIKRLYDKLNKDR